MPNIIINSLVAAITAVTDSFKTAATVPKHRRAILDTGNDYVDLYASALRAYSVFDAAGYAATMGHDADAFQFGHNAKIATNGLASALAFIPVFIVGMTCEYLKIRTQEVAAEEIGDLRAICQKLIEINPSDERAKRIIKLLEELEKYIREKQTLLAELESIKTKTLPSNDNVDLEAANLFAEKKHIENKIKELEKNIDDKKSTLKNIADAVRKDFNDALIDQNPALATDTTKLIEDKDGHLFRFSVTALSEQLAPAKFNKSAISCTPILCGAVNTLANIREFISHAAVSFWIAWAFNYNRIGPRDNSDFKVNDFWTSVSELVFTPIIPTVCAITNYRLARQNKDPEYQEKQKAITEQRVQTRKGQVTFFIKQETEQTLIDIKQKQLARQQKLAGLIADASNEEIEPAQEPVMPAVVPTKIQDHFNRNPRHLMVSAMAGGLKTGMTIIFISWLIFTIVTFVLKFFTSEEKTVADINGKPGSDLTLLAALFCFVLEFAHNGHNNLRAQNKLRDDADEKLRKLHQNTGRTKEQVIDDFQKEIDEKTAIIKTLISSNETLVDQYNAVAPNNLTINKNDVIPSIEKIMKDFSTFQGYFNIHCKVSSFEKWAFKPACNVFTGVYLWRFFNYNNTFLISDNKGIPAHLPYAFTVGAAVAVLRAIESRYNQTAADKYNLLEHLDEFIYDKKCLTAKLDKIIEVLKNNRDTFRKLIQHLEKDNAANDEYQSNVANQHLLQRFM